MNAPDYRWLATVIYDHDGTLDVDVEHELEEIGDLEQLIEQGPYFYAIKEIKIVVHPSHSDMKMPIEEALKL